MTSIVLRATSARSGPPALARCAAVVRRVVLVTALVGAVCVAALDAFDRTHGSQSTFQQCATRCVDLQPAGEGPVQPGPLQPGPLQQGTATP